MEPLIAWFKDTGAQSGHREITPETELIEQGVLDSLAILRLVAFLEEQFAISVPVEEFVPENFRTPAAVAGMMARCAPDRPGRRHWKADVIQGGGTWKFRHRRTSW